MAQERCCFGKARRNGEVGSISSAFSELYQKLRSASAEFEKPLIIRCFFWRMASMLTKQGICRFQLCNALKQLLDAVEAFKSSLSLSNSVNLAPPSPFLKHYPDNENSSKRDVF